ncbi:MAG TPA: YncE family protein [Flavihumibacter sp.]|nr:YncE family protein [Flavihumibacter sp.]
MKFPLLLLSSGLAVGFAWSPMVPVTPAPATTKTRVAEIRQQAAPLSIVTRFPISGNGGWDYLAVSPRKDWLYISHGDQVNIVDKTTGDSVGIIPNTLGVHGIAFDAATNTGYTSNGKSNTVSVFDLNSNQVQKTITTGGNPDAILYEPFSDKIITCNGRGHNLSIIDPRSNVVVDSVALGGKPETAVTDSAGNLYVNIEDKNEILRVDTRTFKVTAHWSLAPGEEPTGLAFDVTGHRLFAACAKRLVVLNADNGKIVAKLPIGEGADGAVFDLDKKIIYTSNGEGSISAIQQLGPDKYVLKETLPTQKGARTICIDQQTHTLYLPVAAFEQQGQTSSGRPKIKPGSFQVLVLR